MLNLDGYSEDELKEIAKAFSNLAAYAKIKARAMRDRKRGNIEDAIAQEKLCDKYYESFPQWAKW